MTGLVGDYLAHRFRWRPVDASFMGAEGHDHRLPPVEPGCIEAELEEIRALHEKAARDGAAHPHDRRMIAAEMRVEEANLESRPRQRNPAWATGEAGFGVISLLLPQSTPWRRDAIAARLAAIPAFLDGVRALIGDGPVPRGWCERAMTEAAALSLFLREDMRLHEAWLADWAAPAEAAAEAFDGFAASLAQLPDADPACGTVHLELVLRELHELPLGADRAMEAARAAFERCGTELEEMAARIDPDTGWQDQLAALADMHPAAADDVIASYRLWDAAARDAAETHGLVTPDDGYGLDYRPLPACFRRVAGPLYFLFYRSPPGLNPGSGSVYWVMSAADPLAHGTAMVKAIHAVHHGSVGHHTQNGRARAAASRLGRIAATDCAMGLAFQGALTLVEGWACHVEDLLMEADGFYSPAEKLLLKSFERRNAASVLVDLGLHSGAWSMAECERFYAEEAGFAPARVHSEVVRNSMFPASRATYWLGVEGIRALRRRWTGTTRAFHDTLLSFGHVPLKLVEDEMAARGLLQ
ncbi:DUF885 family protein [Limimaricola pyoseonensis]|uniref:Uncharacterized conserved protein, DUF885 familyt n=1 Tax=Limimaricola pyoseonensis TaxID=521013 RepID=A0A1G7CBF7_9RHOB|nr:DUF885 family protein [Limimaricola pyoseonensis]SDE36649.1 Uncharacterized conserved protein, DUF885 familyt [Limimaricola pyoseonensis]